MKCPDIITKQPFMYCQVFDYDWGLQDDFMGAALLELTQLDLGHPQDITLELKDPVRPKQHLGEIYLTATLWPRNQQEKEQVLLSSSNCASIKKLLRFFFNLLYLSMRLLANQSYTHKTDK